jgi:hypothetical protein
LWRNLLPLPFYAAWYSKTLNGRGPIDEVFMENMESQTDKEELLS